MHLLPCPSCWAHFQSCVNGSCRPARSCQGPRNHQRSCAPIIALFLTTTVGRHTAIHPCTSRDTAAISILALQPSLATAPQYNGLSDRVQTDMALVNVEQQTPFCRTAGLWPRWCRRHGQPAWILHAQIGSFDSWLRSVVGTALKLLGRKSHGKCA